MLLLRIQLFYNLLSSLCAQYFKIQHPYSQQAVPYYQQNYLTNNYLYQDTESSSSDSDEGRRCKCSCRNCIRPKRCCKNICRNCKKKEIQPSGLIMVPYPVPLLIIPTKNIVENSTKATGETGEHLTKATDRVLVNVTKSTEKPIENPINTEEEIIENSTKTKEETVENSTKAKQKIVEYPTKTKETTIEYSTQAIKYTTEEAKKGTKTESTCTKSTIPVYMKDNGYYNIKRNSQTHFKSPTISKHSDLMDKYETNENKYLNRWFNENYRPTKSTTKYSYRKQYEYRKNYEMIPLPDRLAIKVIQELQTYNELK